MNTYFFGELLQSITERSRSLLDRTLDRRESAEELSASMIDLSEHLLSGRGEASGVALASEILLRYAELTSGPRIAFFEALAAQFGPNHGQLERAIDAWRAAPSDTTAALVHAAAEPRRQELLRRLNLAPGGTGALVRMREHVLDAIDRRSDLSIVDKDFAHMFSSWFNRGFLVLRRIDWSTAASVLEKIIRYEAVHQIRDWEDLRRRIDPPDRRCYAFFHPALIDEPLIFVEVALTGDIPSAIGPILGTKRDVVEPARQTTAVFYSISNCQRGLAGVSFGNFLIKQVVEEIARENQRLKTFVTLSPVPNFARWFNRERLAPTSGVLTPEDRVVLAGLDRPNWWQDEAARDELEEPMMRAAAWYFLHVKTRSAAPADSVARFHLGNGARLDRLNWLADTSDVAMGRSYGLMVNYLYDLDEIEKNHEAYAQQRTVAASSGVTRLARSKARDPASPAGMVSSLFT